MRLWPLLRCAKNEGMDLCYLWKGPLTRSFTVIVCAFHGVSPRDRWLRVLPWWQLT